MIQMLDWDLTRWRQPVVFNLELMKLAYYEKTHNNNIVTMIPRYKEDFDGRIYIRKDYEDFEYPANIMSNPNVVYGGNAISTSYDPLPPWVEQSPADTSIYNAVKRFYQGSSVQENIFRMMFGATHLRLSLDGKTIFPFFEKQLKNHDKKVFNVIIHDKELKCISDVLDIINYIKKYSRKTIRFGFKYPLEINTTNDLEKWIEIPKTTNLRNLIVKEPIEWEGFEEPEYSRQTLGYIITKDWGDNLEQILIDCLLQGYYWGKKNVVLNLRLHFNWNAGYIEQELLNILNSLFETMVWYRKDFFFTPFIFCKYVYHFIPTYEKEALFRAIQEKYPQLFLLLYNIQYVIVKNHQLEPHVLTEQEFEETSFYDKLRNKEEHRRLQEAFERIIRPSSIYLDR